MMTVRERALIPSGGYSDIQNLRPKHPGFEKRDGQDKFHSQADGTLQVVSLYQFSKGKRSEKAFFAQYSDGDVHNASADPPASITGGFGDEVFSGNTSPKPASWSHLDDILIMSDTVNQHHLYAGSENYVDKFVKYDGAATPPNIPDVGFDYTKEVTDGESTTAAILDSLKTFTEHECAFLCTPIQANRLKVKVKAANANTSVLTLRYRKNDSTWADASVTDGTNSGGASLNASGDITWSFPSDEIPHYMYGITGFWYRMDWSATLDGEVEISSIEYGTDSTGSGSRTSFTPLVNLWDGYAPYATEARVYDDSASVYYIFSTDSIEIDNSTSSDKFFFNYPDKIQGFYVDVGETPNTTSSTTINAVYCWDGDSWVACTNVSDGTNGLANSGWVTFDRVDNQEPRQFQNAKYNSYWYYFTVDQTLSSNVIISIEVMPHFNVEELGTKGNCNIVWKDRGVYTFNKFPQYLYVSAKNKIMSLNGDDYGILEAGDGRSNAITCIKKFHNEIMVWQEEKGIDGGCLTLFEGYSPDTFGKLVLSTKVGTFNAQSAVVVDGVLTSTASDETLKTLAFFISHYGICATDGRTVTIISDDIQDYFDPKKLNCIRRGYEHKMWIAHDSAYNILRVGLVTGSSATDCNTFLIFDLVDKVWLKDNLAQEMSCIVEVEADTGDIPILQYGGGIDDGLVYRLNTGCSDDGTAIDAYAIMEISHYCSWVNLRRLLLQVKAQSGEVRITPYRNSVAGDQLTVAQTAESTGQEARRHVLGIGVQDANISLKLQNNATKDDFYLMQIGAEIYEKPGH